MKTVDVGIDFYPRLANRDGSQGDGKHTAEEFRERYLKELDVKSSWEENIEPYICFDFVHVLKIAPSFANEAFAYFTKYAKPEQILRRILFSNISDVKRQIIEIELKSAFSERY